MNAEATPNAERPPLPSPVETAGPNQSAGDRPEGLPEKFWDPDRGSVRLDAMIRSYAELEKRFSGQGIPSRPSSAESYEITLDPQVMARDPEVDSKLHAAGFSNDQAQLVYDLAAEKLAPMVESAAAETEFQRQKDRLVSHFGGEDKWHTVSRQIAQWGRRHFPSDVFQALSGTAEGVLAMHKLMASDEPALGASASEGATATDEEGLRNLMRDPRYWRERDPAVVRRVRQGFQDLYRN